MTPKRVAFIMRMIFTAVILRQIYKTTSPWEFASFVLIFIALELVVLKFDLLQKQVDDLESGRRGIKL